MSLLYKDSKDIKYSCEIRQIQDDKIELNFWSDCGKFGTDEMLDRYVLSTGRLLRILQDREDIDIIPVQQDSLLIVFDRYILTTERLLQILQEREDIEDDEI